LGASDVDSYHRRFRATLDYVDAHPGDDLSLERLSGIAEFSKYHFHRQFSAIFGIGVHKYVQLVRMKRASFEAAFRRRGFLAVALECGYDSHESFSRAFKLLLGQTPSEFRERPAWHAWHAAFRPLSEIRMRHMSFVGIDSNVTVIDFPETRVAALEHRGDPALVPDAIRRFIEWRRQNGLAPGVSATFNILYDNPEDTPPDAYRLDICAAIRRPVAPNSAGVVEKIIPGCRCARLRHVGPDETLAAALEYLYSTWLPASSEEPADVPLFIQRVRFFPDVPEGEAVVDIFLPLR
jgi:AraC family transcriptional regulator